MAGLSRTRASVNEREQSVRRERAQRRRMRWDDDVENLYIKKYSRRWLVTMTTRRQTTRILSLASRLSKWFGSLDNGRTQNGTLVDVLLLFGTKWRMLLAFYRNQVATKLERTHNTHRIQRRRWWRHWHWASSAGLFFELLSLSIFIFFFRIPIDYRREEAGPRRARLFHAYSSACHSWIVVLCLTSRTNLTSQSLISESSSTMRYLLRALHSLSTSHGKAKAKNVNWKNQQTKPIGIPCDAVAKSRWELLYERRLWSCAVSGKFFSVKKKTQQHSNW